VVESCSNPQKTWQVFESALKIIYFFFLSDIIRSVGFRFGWLKLFGPRPKLLDGSISLKFSLETRPESNSFETLIGFLRFQVQKLWPNNNKITN